MDKVHTADQTGVACLFMRGGTSRGPFFLASDLPADEATRNRVLLSVLGSPDQRQIDGLGGANPLTSKAGIVSPSKVAGVDLDFLFVQLQPGSDVVDTSANCGNMLAAVVPFAIERGLIKVGGDQTTARVLTLNTGMQCDITVSTTGAGVNYAGSTKIDGVPGSSAPIRIDFSDTAGSICSSLLPTGRVRDTLQFEDGTTFSIDVTCIDNGMPMVLIRAADLQCTGCESLDAMNSDVNLKRRLELMRLKAGLLMGLGDVSQKNYPKMCLLAAPQHGGSIATRCFIPHVCHDAIGVLGAVTVATACVLENSIAVGLAQIGAGRVKTISIEHPSGEFSVELEMDPDDSQRILRAGLIRTARLIMRGEVMIPTSIWNGK